MVQRQMSGVRVKNSLAIQFGKEYIKNNMVGDWLGGIAHMSGKVLSLIHI